MSTRRQRLFEEACELVGNPPLQIEHSYDGWPGTVSIQTENGRIGAAVHVSLVGSHARKPYEMRFQNPADKSPVDDIGGKLPILVGVDQQNDLLVVTDGRSRLGRQSRFSILFHADILTEAASDGWAEYISETGERIVALHPKLLPIFVEGTFLNALPDAAALISSAAASGVASDGSDEAAARARVIASRLVRSSVFSRDVKAAYDEKCALCQLGINLVQGAHIFPASATGSQDKVWNGIAMCHNHHAAFDKHFIWVEPRSKKVRFRPDVARLAATDPAVFQFINNTQPKLILPAKVALHPRVDMFEKRYEHYVSAYDWV